MQTFIHNNYWLAGLFLIGLGILSLYMYKKHKNLGQNREFIAAQKMVAAFLKLPVDTVSCVLLKGGMTYDTVIRCQAQGQAYIVKIFRDSSAARYEIEWTKHADKLGIGPRVHYADFATATLMTDLVPGAPLLPAQVHNPTILQNVAAHLLKLHTSLPSSSFAPNTRDLFSSLEEKYKKLSTAGELKGILEKSWNYLLSIKKDIEAPQAPLVPCHNDLNPLNVFVQDDNVTIIDWGDAALGNRYYDIMVFFVFNTTSPEDEEIFLQAYDKQLMQPTWRHYLTFLRHCVHFDFALNLLLGVQYQQKELLMKTELDHVQPLAYYLELLANKKDFDARGLYHMAIASLLHSAQLVRSN